MDYLTFLKQELAQAAEIARSYFGKVNATTKPGDNNQVLTEADIAIGKQLVAAAIKHYPDYNIIDEEAGVIDNKSTYTWVIDPIEATSNFAAGLPQYGIMMGLLKEDKPIAGGIITPAYGNLYLAEKGKGATCNGKAIKVTQETDLSKMLVSYGMDGDHSDPQRTIRECRMLADIVLAVRNIRNTGCEALDPMYVAEGRLGARINQTSKIWDNVAPQVITEEAGALWTAADGSSLDYGNPLSKAEQNYTFCVASPSLHNQLQNIIRLHSI